MSKVQTVFYLGLAIYLVAKFPEGVKAVNLTEFQAQFNHFDFTCQLFIENSCRASSPAKELYKAEKFCEYLNLDDTKNCIGNYCDGDDLNGLKEFVCSDVPTIVLSTMTVLFCFVANVVSKLRH